MIYEIHFLFKLRTLKSPISNALKLSALIVAFLCGHSFAQTAPTNNIRPSLVTVIVDTNGILQSPTNLFAANSNALKAAVGGGGATNLATTTTNGLMSSNAVQQLNATITNNQSSVTLFGNFKGNGAGLTNGNLIPSAAVFVDGVTYNGDFSGLASYLVSGLTIGVTYCVNPAQNGIVYVFPDASNSGINQNADGSFVAVNTTALFLDTTATIGDLAAPSGFIGLSNTYTGNFSGNVQAGSVVSSDILSNTLEARSATITNNLSVAQGTASFGMSTNSQVNITTAFSVGQNANYQLAGTNSPLRGTNVVAGDSEQGITLWQYDPTQTGSICFSSPVSGGGTSSTMSAIQDNCLVFPGYAYAQRIKVPGQTLTLKMGMGFIQNQPFNWFIAGTQGPFYKMLWDSTEMKFHFQRGTNTSYNNFSSSYYDGWPDTMTIDTLADTVRVSHLSTTNLILAATHTPASSSETNLLGAVAYDASYLYIWTATNVNKRIAFSTW